MTAPITCPARAKLNLTLRVVGRREDGYHLLDSLVAFAEYGDEVRAEPAPAITLAIEGPFALALDGDRQQNLVLCAAHRLQAAAGVRTGAAITLTKRLPVASGIGGGSSDTAATLRALSALWGVALPADRMAELGLGLGADVPVCLLGRLARLQGIGERLTPWGELPAVPIVLVNQGVAVSTPEVFRALAGRYGAVAELPSALPRDPPALARLLEPHGNDLERPAIERAPVIRDAIDALGGMGGCLLARMSGSGATCFGLFADAQAAADAAEDLRARHPEWWVVATRLATTDP